MRDGWRDSSGAHYILWIYEAYTLQSTHRLRLRDVDRPTTTSRHTTTSRATTTTTTTMYAAMMTTTTTMTASATARPAVRAPRATTTRCAVRGQSLERGRRSVARSSGANDDTRSSADDTMSALDALLPKTPEPEREPEAVVKAPRERKAGEISPEMRKKLLGESVGLGGLPEKPMPSNIFLNIILGISAIVVIAYIGGIRP